MKNKKNLSELDDLPPLRDVIEAHDLRAQKALGQNFLLDQNITDKIVRESGDFDGVYVFEIGPGPGGLTRSLLKSAAKKVIAIEFDPRAVAALQDLQARAGERLDIHHGDALAVDLPAMVPEPRAIVANLPYNIATPLLINWLKDMRKNQNTYGFMSLMFQKEVADRICAPPGGKAYGRLSVMAQWLCDVRVIYDLPPSAFTPPPKVRSAVVHFVPKTLPSDAPSFAAVQKITEAAFVQRRKMIRSSLKKYIGAIEALGLDPTSRAENLKVEDFINLAKLLKI